METAKSNVNKPSISSIIRTNWKIVYDRFNKSESEKEFYAWFENFVSSFNPVVKRMRSKQEDKPSAPEIRANLSAFVCQKLANNNVRFQGWSLGKKMTEMNVIMTTEKKVSKKTEKKNKKEKPQSKTVSKRELVDLRNEIPGLENSEAILIDPKDYEKFLESVDGLYRRVRGGALVPMKRIIGRRILKQLRHVNKHPNQYVKIEDQG